MHPLIRRDLLRRGQLDHVHGRRISPFLGLACPAAGGWQSGNLVGRPKSPVPRTSAFDILVEKTVIVTYHGIAREITSEEAVQQRIYQDAIAGKGMAIRTGQKGACGVVSRAAARVRCGSLGDIAARSWCFCFAAESRHSGALRLAEAEAHCRIYHAVGLF
jgi:hypothetical protein